MLSISNDTMREICKELSFFDIFALSVTHRQFHPLVVETLNKRFLGCTYEINKKEFLLYESLFYFAKQNNVEIFLSNKLQKFIAMNTFITRNFRTVEFLLSISRIHHDDFFIDPLLQSIGILGYMNEYSYRPDDLFQIKYHTARYGNLIPANKKDSILKYLRIPFIECAFHFTTEWKMELNMNKFDKVIGEHHLKGWNTLGSHMIILLLEKGKIQDDFIPLVIDLEQRKSMKWLARNRIDVVQLYPSYFIKYLEYIDDRKSALKVIDSMTQNHYSEYLTLKIIDVKCLYKLRKKFPCIIEYEMDMNFPACFVEYIQKRNIKFHLVDYSIIDLKSFIRTLSWCATERSNLKLKFQTRDYNRIYCALAQMGPQKIQILQYMIKNRCFPTVESIKQTLGKFHEFLIRYGIEKTDAYIRLMFQYLSDKILWNITPYIYDMYVKTQYPTLLTILKESIREREMEFVLSYEENRRKEIIDTLNGL